TVADKNNIPIIRNVPDNILDIWGAISAKAYKYDWAIRQKGDDMARWHVGWIAQDIVDAFAKAGENASEWALVVYNESSSINTPLLTSPEYTLQNKLKETSEWRVILDECNAMELLYQRRQLK
ncbi:tail fiber domain-containing protein, partial [Klebsiella pneumoniae]